MWAITSNIQHLQIKILTTFALLQKTIMTKNIYLHTSDLVIRESSIGFLLNTLNVDLVITVTTIGLTL